MFRQAIAALALCLAVLAGHSDAGQTPTPPAADPGLRFDSSLAPHRCDWHWTRKHDGTVGWLYGWRDALGVHAVAPPAGMLSPPAPKKADEPVLNFGVQLDPTNPRPGQSSAPSVMGTDEEAAKLVLSSAAGDRDCPDNQCRPRPRPRPEPPDRGLGGFVFEPWHAAAGLIGLAVFLFVLVLFVIFLLFCYSVLRSLLTPTPSSSPEVRS